MLKLGTKLCLSRTGAQQATNPSTRDKQLGPNQLIVSMSEKRPRATRAVEDCPIAHEGDMKVRGHSPIAEGKP